jgi:hypothetical protein
MKPLKPQLVVLKQKVLRYYYRTNFTVVELLVIVGLLFWLTRKAVFAII